MPAIPQCQRLNVPVGDSATVAKLNCYYAELPRGGAATLRFLLVRAPDLTFSTGELISLCSCGQSTTARKEFAMDERC
jgi:hypothetical protein